MQATSTLPRSLPDALAYVLAQGALKVSEAPAGLRNFDQATVAMVYNLFHVPEDEAERTFATSFVTGFRAFLTGRDLLPGSIEGWDGFDIDEELSRRITQEELPAYLNMPIMGRNEEINPILAEVTKALEGAPDIGQTSPTDPFSAADYAISDVLAFLAGRREGPGFHPCEAGDPSAFGIGPLQATYNPETGEWSRNPDAKGAWQIGGPPDENIVPEGLKDLQAGFQGLPASFQGLPASFQGLPASFQGLPASFQALGAIAALTGVLDSPAESNERIVDVMHFLASTWSVQELRSLVLEKAGPWGEGQKALALATLDEIEAGSVQAESGVEPVGHDTGSREELDDGCGSDTGAQPDLDDEDTDIDDTSTSDEELDS